MRMLWLRFQIAVLKTWVEDRIDDALCKLGKCRRVVMFDTPSGIGGRCVHCSELHGWMSNEELRKMLHIRAPGEELEVRELLRGTTFKMGTVPTPTKPAVVTPPPMYAVRGPRGRQ